MFFAVTRSADRIRRRPGLNLIPRENSRTALVSEKCDLSKLARLPQGPRVRIGTLGEMSCTTSSPRETTCISGQRAVTPYNRDRLRSSRVSDAFLSSTIVETHTVYELGVQCAATCFIAPPERSNARAMPPTA